MSDDIIIVAEPDIEIFAPDDPDIVLTVEPDITLESEAQAYFDSNTLVTSPYGTAARAIGIRAGEWRPLLDLPAAKNDGTLIDAVALAAQMQPNINYHAEDGNYLLNSTLSVTTAGTNILSPSYGANFKIQDHAPQSSYISQGTKLTISPIRLAADRTGFQGSVDGNRLGQDQTAWNAQASPGFTYHGYGIEAGDYVNAYADMFIDAKVQNCITQAVLVNLCVRPDVSVEAVSCGGVVRGSLTVDDRYRTVTGRDISVKGFRQAIIGINLAAPSGLTRIDDVRIFDQFGDEDPNSAANSLLASITITDADELVIGSIVTAARQLTGINTGLAFSIIGVRKMTADYLSAFGFPGIQFEYSVSESEIGRLELDAAYSVSTNGSFNTGLLIYNNSPYLKYQGLLTSTKFRNVQTPRYIRVRSGTIKRLQYWGLQLNALEDALFENIRTPGCRYGAYLQNNVRYDSFHSFAGMHDIPVKTIRFHGCDFSGALLDGVHMEDGVDVEFSSCKAENCGQGRTRRAILPGDDNSGVGFNVVDSLDTVSPGPFQKLGLTFLNPKAGDTQDWTNGWYSYDPGNPLKPVTNVPNRLRIGQTMNVQNASYLNVYRLRMSGTSAGGATFITVSMRNPGGGRPAAKSGQTWEADIYATVMAMTGEITGAAMELCELDSGGALLAHTDTANFSGGLAAYSAQRAFSQSTTVRAGIKVVSKGTIHNGNAYSIDIELSAAQLFQVGHATSLANDVGGVVGVIGSGGVLPDGMAITGPGGGMTIELVSITQNTSFTQPKDIVVYDIEQDDDFDVQVGADVPFYVAGTGTISTNGLTLTGSGTIFDTEIDGALWIVVGGVARQIGWIDSDTTGGLRSAFPTNLVNQPFQMVKHALWGKPSQDNPIVINSTQVVDPVILGGRYYGNLVNNAPVVSAVSGALHTAP